VPPLDHPSKGYPVFFAIHGGGDIAGSRHGGVTGQELTEVMNRGWVLVSIDYRLLPGVFLEDIFGDVQDAYNWVRTELVKIIPINTDLITVFGWSAGGGLAVMGGYLFSPRPKAVISFYPFCTNWTDPYSYKPETPVDPLIVAAANELSAPVVTEYHPTGKTDPKNILWKGALDSGKIGWLMTTHDPNFPTEQIMANLRRFSATENMDQNYPPTYLAHGLADSLVPYSQAVQLSYKLNGYNIPYVLDLVPDADHVFDGDTRFWQDHTLPAFDFVQNYMQISTVETAKTRINIIPTSIADETSVKVPKRYFNIPNKKRSIKFLEK